MLIASAAFKRDVKIPESTDGDKGFALVELFTSEGCSSCPPADELVGRIQKESPDKPVYILAYHVTYWDHQGWKDSFSDADYTERQKKYAGWLHLETVYTPQIVLNGRTEFVGSDKGALLRGINAGLQETPTHTLAISSKVKNGEVVVEYQTSGSLNQTDLVIALVQKAGQSNVRAGENAGRRLDHVQIVRKLTTERLRADSGKMRISLPKDYLGKEWELIGFIQHETDGRILSASRAPLVQ